MSKDKFLQSNESGMLNYMLRVYGNVISKSVFVSMGCEKFYERLLDERIFKKVCNGPNPLVTPTEKFYQKYR